MMFKLPWGKKDELDLTRITKHLEKGSPYTQQYRIDFERALFLLKCQNDGEADMELKPKEIKELQKSARKAVFKKGYRVSPVEEKKKIGIPYEIGRYLFGMEDGKEYRATIEKGTKLRLDAYLLPPTESSLYDFTMSPTVATLLFGLEAVNTARKDGKTIPSHVEIEVEEVPVTPTPPPEEEKEEEEMLKKALRGEYAPTPAPSKPEEKPKIETSRSISEQIKDLYSRVEKLEEDVKQYDSRIEKLEEGYGLLAKIIKEYTHHIEERFDSLTKTVEERLNKLINAYQKDPLSRKEEKQEVEVEKEKRNSKRGVDLLGGHVSNRNPESPSFSEKIYKGLSSAVDGTKQVGKKLSNVLKHYSLPSRMKQATKKSFEKLYNTFKHYTPYRKLYARPSQPCGNVIPFYI